MKISLTSVLVKDQQAALDFYTGKLGFRKKVDLPVGEFRWLTVVSPEEPQGTELVLEPMGIPAAVDYQQALYDGGIPLTAFKVDDVRGEFERLQDAGIVFRGEPTDVGTAMIAIFEDNCGNLIQIYEEYPEQA